MNYNNKFKSDLNKIPDNEVFDTTENASKFKVAVKIILVIYYVRTKFSYRQSSIFLGL